MGIFRTPTNGTGKRILNELQAINLTTRKIKKHRIAIVQLGLHKSSDNCSSSFLGQILTNTPKISNMKEACLKNLSYVFMKGKMLVKHNTKIFHRVAGVIEISEDMLRHTSH